MNCPRCGAKMEYGACSECGFPIVRKSRRWKLIQVR